MASAQRARRNGRVFLILRPLFIFTQNRCTLECLGLKTAAIGCEIGSGDGGQLHQDVGYAVAFACRGGGSAVPTPRDRSLTQSPCNFANVFGPFMICLPWSRYLWSMSPCTHPHGAYSQPVFGHPLLAGFPYIFLTARMWPTAQVPSAIARCMRARRGCPRRPSCTGSSWAQA